MDANHIAYRQVTNILWDNDRWEISCIDDNLADQYVEIDEFTTIISRAEFDAVWEKQLAAHKDSFRKTKEKYLLGSEVTGMIKKFYPQGTIVQVESGFGVFPVLPQQANHAEAARAAGVKIKGKVMGYDEQNLWLILSENE